MEIKPIVQARLVDEVYQRLRELIFQNSFIGGQKLDIEHIAKQLGVSRQPIMEAITRLAQEGLLIIRPRVGTFVRQWSSADIHNILEARLMMELFALSHAQPQPSEIQALYAYVDRMDAIAYSESFHYLSYNEQDVQFHTAIIRLIHNPLIERLHEGLHAQYVPVRAFYRRAHQHTLTNYGEHRAIVDALSNGDIPGAAMVLETHIRNAERGIQHILQQLGSDLL